MVFISEDYIAQKKHASIINLCCNVSKIQNPNEEFNRLSVKGDANFHVSPKIFVIPAALYFRSFPMAS